MPDNNVINKALARIEIMPYDIESANSIIIAAILKQSLPIYFKKKIGFVA